jgi:RNA polymerase sigma-70 factor (ECF subfamily)
MFFSKSITFDEEDLGNVAVAAQVSSTFQFADSEFVERLRAGDADAFDNLVTRYSGDIYALLYRLMDDPDEAGDLTQETFLAALKAIKTFRGEADLKTWLFRIAVNQSRNRFRWWKRRKRDKTVSLDAPIGDSETTLSDSISDNAANPEEEVLRLEREQQLSDALNGLSDTFREVIVMCDIEGLSYEEISQTLGVNLGTVKSRIARGREELRKRLYDF